MPLMKKLCTNSKLRLINYIACCPCIWTLAACCMAVCQRDMAFSMACSPCNDSPLTTTATIIANRALIYLSIERKHPKLTALATDTWNPGLSYDQLTLDGSSRQLMQTLTTSVYALINSHNFGAINSEQLEPAEIQLISDQLREAIYVQLPDPNTFFSGAQQAAVDNHNNGALNDFLARTLLSSIQGDFIKQQLDVISDQLMTQRLYQLSIAARNQAQLHSKLITGTLVPPSYSTGPGSALSPTRSATPSPVLSPLQNNNPTSSCP